MSRNVNIISYSEFSASARGLSLKVKEMLHGTNTHVRRYHTDSPFTRKLRNKGIPKADNPTVYIKWGNVKGLDISASENVVLMNFKDSEWATDKLKFFNEFKDTELTPRFFTSPAGAQSYLDAATIEGPLLVERNVLSGHSGAGIRLLGKGDTVTLTAKLWVLYVKKIREFRLHFVRTAYGAEAFNYYWQEKLLKKGLDEADAAKVNRFQIRNHDNGWIYATNIEPIPDAVKNTARAFVNSQKNTLDFGALDIIWNKKDNKAYALEVNTAPGLTGRTLDWYAQSIANNILDSTSSNSNPEEEPPEAYVPEAYVEEDEED